MDPPKYLPEPSPEPAGTAQAQPLSSANSPPAQLATPPPPPPPDFPALPPSDEEEEKRQGKIAHLPKAQRDLINRLFDDGFTYRAVREKLAEQGVQLNGYNLHNWFHGGYQDEIRHRDRQDSLTIGKEHILDLAQKEDGVALSLSSLQLAVTRLAQQLYELEPATHNEAFKNDTRSYLRMLSTLARISKALLAFQKYFDEAARIKAANLPKLDIDRDLEDREFELLFQRADRVFNVAPSRRKNRGIKLPEGPIEPGTQTAPTATTAENGSSSSDANGSTPSTSPPAGPTPPRAPPAPPPPAPGAST